MKKIVVLLGVFLVCLTGCGSKTKTMVCTRTLNQGEISMDLRYEVTYKKNDVEVVKSIEKVKSDSSEVLDVYKKTIEETYKPYNGIEHYNYEVKIDNDTLTSTVTIDYSKVDTSKLLEIDSANGKLIKDGKINIDDIKSAYESVGATCEK